MEQTAHSQTAPCRRSVERVFFNEIAEIAELTVPRTQLTQVRIGSSPQEARSLLHEIGQRHLKNTRTLLVHQSQQYKRETTSLERSRLARWRCSRMRVLYLSVRHVFVRSGLVSATSSIASSSFLSSSCRRRLDLHSCDHGMAANAGSTCGMVVSVW